LSLLPPDQATLPTICITPADSATDVLLPPVEWRSSESSISAYDWQDFINWLSWFSRTVSEETARLKLEIAEQLGERDRFIASAIAADAVNLVGQKLGLDYALKLGGIRQATHLWSPKAQIQFYALWLCSQAQRAYSCELPLSSAEIPDKSPIRGVR
jgi:hypothetical protein